MTFRPTADRVLIRRADVETRSSTGLIIPDINGEKANRGTVVDLGPGRLTRKDVLVPVELNAGDEVLFTDGAGNPVRVDGRDYLVINYDDILAVVEKQQVDT